jgi:hypothetical protein
MESFFELYKMISSTLETAWKQKTGMYVDSHLHLLLENIIKTLNIPIGVSLEVPKNIVTMNGTIPDKYFRSILFYLCQNPDCAISRVQKHTIIFNDYYTIADTYQFLFENSTVMVSLSQKPTTSPIVNIPMNSQSFAPEAAQIETFYLIGDNIDALIRFREHVYEKYNNQDSARSKLKILVSSDFYSNANDVFQEIVTTLPRFSKDALDHLILSKTVKDFLIKDIKTFFEKEKWYNDVHLNWKRGYLFEGEPGCGKTTAIKCIAQYFGLDIYFVRLNLVHTDQQLNMLFNAIRRVGKCMIVLEDIDAIGGVTLDRMRATSDSSNDDSSSNYKLSLSAILNELDGIYPFSGQLILMTTNYPEKLDPALIRPGRIDVRIKFGKCSQQDIIDLFSSIYGNADYPEISELEEYAFTPADVKSILLSHKPIDAIEKLKRKKTGAFSC